MPHKLARGVLLASAGLATGYLIKSLKDADFVVVTEETTDHTDYTAWGEHGHRYDHDWRSGF